MSWFQRLARCGPPRVRGPCGREFWVLHGRVEAGTWFRLGKRARVALQKPPNWGRLRLQGAVPEEISGKGYERILGRQVGC